MENLLLLVAGTYLLRQRRRPVRRPIGRYGCSLMAPAAFVPVATTTRCGDHLYHGAFRKGGQVHGIIHIDLAQSLVPEDASLLLHTYLQSLQRTFSIEANTGMETGGTELLQTVRDYWQDAAGVDWKVKGYTDGRSLSLLYVRNLSAGRCDAEEAFLNSLSLDPLR